MEVARYAYKPYMINRTNYLKTNRHKHSTIRELVFGLEDGIVSTTGAVIGIAAGTGNKPVVILSGMVIVVVEALSMAAGTYLSSKSKRQMLQHMIQQEREEIENSPEEETEELREMYRQRGFCKIEIDLMVQHITKDKKLWLEEMMHKELGIGTMELEDSRAGVVVMWLAYTVGGLVPIIPFLLFGIRSAMITAFIAGLCTLFAIGTWKARVTKTNVLFGGLEMLAVSAIAGLIGFAVGRIVGSLTGIDVGV